MITKLNGTTFDNYIAKGLKIVEFYAIWCGYCSKQFSVLSEMKEVEFGMLNAEEAPEIAMKYGINGYPTFVIFQDGKESGRFSGFHTKYQIMEYLTKYFSK